MPRKVDPELRSRAVRLVTEHRGQYPSLVAATAPVAKQVDGGRHEVTTRGLEQSRKLKAENRKVRDGVAILKAGTTPRGNSTPATNHHGVHVLKL